MRSVGNIVFYRIDTFNGNVGVVGAIPCGVEERVRIPTILRAPTEIVSERI
jgi:hypothetical protein